MTTPPAPPPRENPAARNVHEIANIEREASQVVPPGERISLAITNAAGTPLCAALHVLLFLAWTTFNRTAPESWQFDPYPFGLLTMIVSMEGVILAVFVLIAQNRMSAQTDRRDHRNLQVNLLAEQEMTMVLRMLDRIAQRLGTDAMEAERDEALKLMERTNLYELMEELRRKFK